MRWFKRKRREQKTSTLPLNHAVINRRHMRPPITVISPLARDRAIYHEMMDELTSGRVTPRGHFSEGYVDSDVRTFSATYTTMDLPARFHAHGVKYIFEFEGIAVRPANGGYGPDPFDKGSDGLFHEMMFAFEDALTLTTEHGLHPDWYLGEDGWPPLDRYFFGGSRAAETGFIVYSHSDGEEFMGHLPGMLIGFVDVEEVLL